MALVRLENRNRTGMLGSRVRNDVQRRDRGDHIQEVAQRALTHDRRSLADLRSFVAARGIDQVPQRRHGLFDAIAADQQMVVMK